ncbi:DUF554 domain-containing protein [Oscillatoria sp. FACHB-1407]|uniref:DUF554 domain-containing protein n=1 Tax=Oscillatoria sp. FACHB-1407 TaxID=2692847 RepID=UPI0016894369|nr:DUF554 domain-containing protein [Oscillatoria sp. FACHB-1407]MBD2462821.1 DUF554 domain-containing protein [Oscillatoria sp. FACHB-1407]
MTLDFWARTSGTWINVATIILGTLVGVGLGGRLPLRMQQIITQALGLITLFVGLSLANSLNEGRAGVVDGVILGLLVLVVGGLLGEWCQLEKALEAIGDWLKTRFKGKGKFTEGFVAASLLFCVGPLALIGSLNNGLVGDSRLLVLKASMDGLAAIALTSGYGMGVGFSALSILLYQGGISLAAGLLAQALPDPATSPLVMLVTGVGGLMIVGLSLNLLEIAKVRVASFLPALLLAPIVHSLIEWLT